MVAVPGVTRAAVGIRRHPVMQEDHLVAWLVPASLDPTDLSKTLEARLPAYMVPSTYVLLNGLPQLPSEKVDRAALVPPPQWSLTEPTAAAAAEPAMGIVGSISAISHSCRAGHFAASTSLSSTVSLTGKGPWVLDDMMMLIGTIWAEVLGVPLECISSSSDFFALGGSSLTVGIMNSRLRASLKLPNMSGLLAYQHPVLKELTEAVVAACRGAAAATAAAAHAVPPASAGELHVAAAVFVKGDGAVGTDPGEQDGSYRISSSNSSLDLGSLAEGSKDNKGRLSKRLEGERRAGTMRSFANATAQQYVGAAVGIAGET